MNENELKYEWICAICGEGMHSKCPSCRTVFPENQHAAVLSNLLGYTIVDNGNAREVMINFTLYMDDLTKHPVIHTIERLNEFKNSGALESALCSHVWVLNSHKKTQCSMGCTHDNLNDVDRLREERAAFVPSHKPHDLMERVWTHVIKTIANTGSNVVYNYKKYDTRCQVLDSIYSLRSKISGIFDNFIKDMPREEE